MLVNNIREKTQERRLIEAVQNGNKKAYGEIVRMHQKRLFRFIYGMLGSFDATEDIVQESFLKAYKAINTFNPAYSFYPWLSTIARNLAYNYIHREEKKESLDKLELGGFNQKDISLGPLDKLLNKESQEKFYKALKAMPMKYRSVFVLRHFEDMDYADIASYLKIPPGTVDSRLYRARKYLMEELKDMLNLE